MRMLLLFFYLLIIIVSLAFAALNASMVDVHLYWFNQHLPLSFVMIVCLGLGLILGALVFLGKYLSLRMRLKKLKQQIQLLEQEIKNLRTIPIADAH